MTTDPSRAGGGRPAADSDPAAPRRRSNRTKAEPSGRSNPRRELVENEIYEQASRLFAERGFAGTSLQDIADVIGVTRPALYYYVKSKDEILAKLVAEVTEVNAAAIRKIANDSQLDPMTKLRQIARLTTFRRAKQPMRFLLLVRSEAELPEPLAKAHDAARRNALRSLLKVIEEGIAAGQFRVVEPRTTALSVIGMCNWVAWWYHDGDAVSEQEVADQIADLAVAMVAQSPDRALSSPNPRGALALIRQDVAYLERLLDTE